jgi:hypothetical protein
MWYIAGWQYVIAGIIYSKGEPYREPVYRNFWVIGLIAANGIHVLIYGFINRGIALVDVQVN